MRIKRSK